MADKYADEMMGKMKAEDDEDDDVAVKRPPPKSVLDSVREELKTPVFKV